jgi:hypothetical protein
MIYSTCITFLAIFHFASSPPRLRVSPCQSFCNSGAATCHARPIPLSGQGQLSGIHSTRHETVTSRHERARAFTESCRDVRGTHG